MKKGIIVIAFLILCLACVITRPDKEAHEKALKECIQTAIEQSDEEDEESFFSGLASLLSKGLSSLVLEEFDIDYHNYILVSVCKISTQDVSTYSVGVLNQIIIVGKEKIQQVINENIG